MANLKRRVEQLERRQLALRPSHSTQFDKDALAIYNAMPYLNARMTPTYDEVEPTAIYRRGRELRNKLYGPIIPAADDPHIKRYTRESGEFELAFGREPNAGDMLRYEHLALMHSTENYSRHFGRIIEAWERQLPGLTCPLKFEDGRLFRRLVPERRGEAPNWEEDDGIQPEVRWLTIDEVIVNTQIEAETMLTIPALVFVGVVGVKHQCRPATDAELQRAETESPIKEPTGFMYGRQRFCELLVEVMGA